MKSNSPPLSELTVNAHSAAILAELKGYTHFSAALRLIVEVEAIPQRKCYGRFRLNEADECAFENVES